MLRAFLLRALSAVVESSAGQNTYSIEPIVVSSTVEATYNIKKSKKD